MLQAAEILLMMRPPAEAPSDFQDYTLVAIVAVAAHLSQLALGERYGLPALAQRYGQDVDALEQVGGCGVGGGMGGGGCEAAQGLGEEGDVFCFWGGGASNTVVSVAVR